MAEEFEIKVHNGGDYASAPNGIPLMIQIKHPKYPNHFFGIAPSFTLNCQLASFMQFATLLYFPIDEQKKMLKAAVQKAGKNMLLIDVTIGWEKGVETLFPKETHISKTPYTNTRGTSMVIYLVRSMQTILKW